MLAGLPFILTVAHVADEIDNSEHIFVPADEGFISVAGAFTRHRLPASGKRSDDLIDIAVCKLFTSTANQLHPSISFLEESDCDFKGGIPLTHPVTFAGYPWRKSKTQPGSGRVESEFATFTGSHVDSSNYPHLGYSSRNHITVRFRRKKSFLMRTQRINMAMLPHGISGGGVFSWNTEAAAAGEPASIKLCGICMSYHAEDNIMVATRLSRYVEVIYRSIDYMVKAP